MHIIIIIIQRKYMCKGGVVEKGGDENDTYSVSSSFTRLSGNR